MKTLPLCVLWADQNQTQFSNFKPFIRLNSFVLFVPRIELLERLIDAINKPIGPIGTPDFSREALIFAYISQLFSSKETIRFIHSRSDSAHNLIRSEIGKIKKSIRPLIL